LAGSFPASAINRGSYTRIKDISSSALPFHFVIATFKTLSRAPRLALSIRSGTRLVG
jgi:hypothetical protein